MVRVPLKGSAPARAQGHCVAWEPLRFPHWVPTEAPESWRLAVPGARALKRSQSWDGDDGHVRWLPPPRARRAHRPAARWRSSTGTAALGRAPREGGRPRRSAPQGPGAAAAGAREAGEAATRPARRWGGGGGGRGRLVCGLSAAAGGERRAPEPLGMNAWAVPSAAAPAGGGRPAAPPPRADNRPRQPSP